MRYVALLRGINIGGRTIKMVDLIDCLEKAGLTEVKTILASGNVIFASPEPDSARLQQLLEKTVSERFGWPVQIFLYRQSQLYPIIEAYPFDSTDQDSQHYVIFMRPGLAKELVATAPALDSQVEAVKAGQDVIYWRVRKGQTLKSQFGLLMAKAPFAANLTNRNLKTVKKLAIRPEQ